MVPRFAVRVASLAGIPIRVHLLLPAAVLVALFSTPGWTARSVLLGFLVFFGVMGASVLLHEFGHAAACRRHRIAVHGILLWPLGGATHHDPARRPRARLDVAVAGVIVNLALAVLAGGAALLRDGRLPGLPDLTISTDVVLTAWNLNLALALLNLMPGIPFDGGAVLEALLLPRTGRLRARLIVIGSGAVIGLGVVAVGFARREALLAALGFWCLWEVGRAWKEFREGGMEEEQLLFGTYDFSQGYRSLEASMPGEAEEPPPERSRPREKVLAGERRLREEESREARARRAREEAASRLDGLLERIGREGIGSLSPEERAFLDDESRRLRDRGK